MKRTAKIGTTNGQFGKSIEIAVHGEDFGDISLHVLTRGPGFNGPEPRVLEKVRLSVEAAEELHAQLVTAIRIAKAGRSNCRPPPKW